MNIPNIVKGDLIDQLPLDDKQKLSENENVILNNIFKQPKTPDLSYTNGKNDNVFYKICLMIGCFIIVYNTIIKQPIIVCVLSIMIYIFMINYIIIL